MILALLLQAAAPDYVSPVAAEIGFMRDAQDKGQWQAFGHWAAEEGILVGRRMLPAKELAAALAADEPEQPLYWLATRSILSCHGRTAINSGPYLDPAGGTGRFHTVWQWQEGTGWRYLLDLGIEDAAARLPAAAPVVELERPSCRNLPDPDPPVDYETDKAQGRIAMSGDASLKWEWRLGQWGDRAEQRRLLRVWGWDGGDYRLLIEAEQEN
ncbi:hypothetical protein [Sphingomicrobium aestuariivivum]|uniref:hypothetical protein n=1 Tax=Sphingomicrobium aestuariivivum TaxID=1582356 RepID=UPI001FD71D34|nr:hypothetical protein [Sphingomicrobium aestuariivivum]MCJ8191025.1 hypothetical protein [Sphingomicrobium aestuariivivum]